MVAPVHDRLVVFDADLFHEVRPCQRSRFSLNAWVNSRRPGRSPAQPSPISVAAMLVQAALLSVPEATVGQLEGGGGGPVGEEASTAPDGAADADEGRTSTRTAQLLSRISAARTEPLRQAVAVPAVPWWLETTRDG